jgi:hypothetical protein
MELRLRPTGTFFMAGEVMVRAWDGTASHDDGSQEEVFALIAAVLSMITLIDGLWITAFDGLPASASGWL